MTEKERKRFRNLSLVQNIVICLMYVFLLLSFAVSRAAVEGLFDTIDAQRQGEIDDVVGWGIIMEGIGGVLGGFVVILLGFILIVFTVCLILMWLMFWKANRRISPFSKRRPWGIADQIFKILAGAFWLRGSGEGLAGLFSVESADTVNITATVLSVCISLFYLITGIYLLLMVYRRKEEVAEETEIW